MEISQKIVQMDMFVNDINQLENMMKSESEASMKSQIRLIFHELHMFQKRQMKQEAILEKLVDYCLEK